MVAPFALPSWTEAAQGAVNGRPVIFFGSQFRSSAEALALAGHDVTLVLSRGTNFPSDSPTPVVFVDGFHEGTSGVLTWSLSNVAQQSAPQWLSRMSARTLLVLPSATTFESPMWGYQTVGARSPESARFEDHTVSDAYFKQWGLTVPDSQVFDIDDPAVDSWSTKDHRGVVLAGDDQGGSWAGNAIRICHSLEDLRCARQQLSAAGHRRVQRSAFIPGKPVSIPFFVASEDEYLIGNTTEMINPRVDGKLLPGLSGISFGVHLSPTALHRAHQQIELFVKKLAAMGFRGAGSLDMIGTKFTSFTHESNIRFDSVMAQLATSNRDFALLPLLNALAVGNKQDGSLLSRFDVKGLERDMRVAMRKLPTTLNVPDMTVHGMPVVAGGGFRNTHHLAMTADGRWHVYVSEVGKWRTGGPDEAWGHADSGSLGNIHLPNANRGEYSDHIVPVLEATATLQRSVFDGDDYGWQITVDDISPLRGASANPAMAALLREWTGFPYESQLGVEADVGLA